MNSASTVLGVLRKARELLDTGQSDGIIPAISSLRDHASGRTRDLAYFALMDTALLDGGAVSISLLAGSLGPAKGIELFDATIRRISSKLN